MTVQNIIHVDNPKLLEDKVYFPATISSHRVGNPIKGGSRKLIYKVIVKREIPAALSLLSAKVCQKMGNQSHFEIPVCLHIDHLCLPSLQWVPYSGSYWQY